jgi:hypothetical protein
MVLAGHSNTSYLLVTNARSRLGGHFFMSNDEVIPSNNGAILTILQIIKAIMLGGPVASSRQKFVFWRDV